MKDLKIGAAYMKAGSGTVGGSFCLSTCNTVRSIDFVTFQSHLILALMIQYLISENQFANSSIFLYLTSVRQHNSYSYVR